MRNLQSLSKQELLHKTQSLVAEERRATMELIEHLREVERRMLHLEMGCSSLWDFCVNHLGLSEGASHRRISAMRLIRENPKAEESLKSGNLSLSAAAQLQGFFKGEKRQGKAYSKAEKEKVIESAQGLSKKELEQKLFEISPEAIPTERERTVSEEKTELKVILDCTIMEKFKKLRGYLAHKYPQATYAELIEYLLDETLTQMEKKRGGQSNRMADAKPQPSTRSPKVAASQDADASVNSGEVVKEVASATGSATAVTATSTEATFAAKVKKASLATPRKYIPIDIRRRLWKNCQGRCQFVSEAGARCNSSHGLELDHRLPLSLGGTNEEENLRYLCKNHNLQQAVNVLGVSHMKKWIHQVL